MLTKYLKYILFKEIEGKNDHGREVRHKVYTEADAERRVQYKLPVILLGA